MKIFFTLLLLIATIYATKANFNTPPNKFYPSFLFKTGITSCDINPAVNFNTAVGTYTTYNVALADFDGDGKKDIVSANGEDHTISILQNIHSGSTINTSSFAPKVVLPTGRVTWDVTVGDFNGDGKPDIASANAGSNTVTLFLNTHSGGAISASSFATRLDFGVGSDPQTVKVGDIDGDGKQDIVVGLYGGSSVVILRNTTNNGSVSFASNSLGNIGGYGRGISIGDIDGDGKSDIAFTTEYGGLHLYRNLSVPGQTIFEPKVTFSVYFPQGVVIADLNNDGKLDITVSSFFDNKLYVFENRAGSGSFSASTLAPKVDFPTFLYVYGLAVDDMDGDGSPDIVVVEGQSARASILRNNNISGPITSSSFEPRVSFNAGSSPYGVALGDMNGDGKLDMVVANQYSRNVSVFQNNPAANTFTTTGTLTPFSAFTGSANASQNFTLACTSLTADLVITAPSGFSIALSETGSYSNSINLTPSGGTINNTTIYVKINNSVAGSFSGNITLTSTCTASQNIAVSGTVAVPPPPATALNFDGSNDFVAVNNPFRAYNKEITVEFWMNTPNAKMPFGSLMGQGTSNVDNWGGDNVWLMHPNDDASGTMTFYVNDAGNPRNVTFNIIAGGWHHYAAVSNATSTKVYVDGVLKQTGSGISGTILNNTNSVVHIGKDVRYSSAPRFGNFSIDEVRIWNRALCQDEINNNKNAEINPTGQNGLQEYYRFNQGFVAANNTSVTSLTDLSGNNRNGVLNNFSLNGATSNWVASGATNTGIANAYATPTSAITGTTSVCIGATTTLANSIAGGVWTSSNTGVATIHPSTGLVTSVSAGTTSITYKTECGSVSTVTFTVSATPTATITTSGPTTFCAGGSVQLGTGSAISFAGTNDKVLIAANPALNFSTGTLEAWIKPNTSSDNQGFLAMRDAVSTLRWSAHINEANNTIGIWNGSSFSTVPFNIVAGTWYHVALVMSTTNTQVYVNGSFVGNTNNGINTTYTGLPLTIGSMNDAGYPNERFAGQMDEVRIWNTARSASDILNNYSINISPASSGLVAYYKLNEGVGSTTVNATGTGLNGTLTNNPTWISSSLPTPGTFTYLWSPGGATTPSINVTSIGNYTVTVTSGTGCTATSSPTTVTVNPLPTISAITGTTSICSGSSTSITATSAAGSPIFKWYSASTGGTLLFTGATFTTPNIVSNTTYYVEVSNANACASATRTPVSIAVTTINNQTLSLSSSPICGSGVATVSLASSQAGINYTLRNNANNSIVAGPIQGNGGPLNFNTGTISSTTTYNVLAQTASSGAINFNGTNQYVKAPLNGSQLSNFTIEMWVNPNTGANSGIFQWANGVGTGVPYVYWYYSGATLTMYINGNYYIATNVPTGAWSHIALTFNGSLWSLYKNGALQGAYAGGSNKSSYPPDDLYFGNGYHGYFNGRIDEARIWSVVKTQAEIQGAMSACLTGSENGLLANYKFDDGTGLTAIDSKGGINGILYNMSAATAWVAGNVNCGTQASCSLQMSNMVTATVNPLPTATISGSTTVCQNAVSPIITFTGSNATAPYTFTYTINGGAQQTVTSVGNIATVSVPTGATGNITYTLVSVKDASSTSCSGTASGTATVTINSAPVFTACPGNLTTTNSTGLNSAVVPYIATATGSPAATLSYTFSGATTGSGTGTGAGQLFNIGTTTVTISATNSCGSSICTFTVSVNDITPPTINTVSNISTTATSASGAVVTYTAPIGTDNMGGSSTIQTAGFPSGSTFPIGTTTNTFVVTDAAGLTATSSFTVKVTGLAPSIVVPSTITVNAPANACEVAVNFAATETTAIPASTITYSHQPGSLFPVGTTVVTATATNAVGTSVKTFEVIVKDVTAPTIAATSNINAIATSAAGAIVNYIIPAASDNCAEIINATATPASGSVFPIGITTVTVTATDAAGNTATSSFTVTVVGVPPVIVVPSNITVNNDVANCGAVVSFTATETTAIPASTITYSHAPGTVFPVGTTTVTATATNAVGSSTGTFTVTVTDNEKPVVITRPVSVTLVNGAASVTAAQVNNGSTDNCSIQSVVLSGKTNYTCADLGTHTVTLTVTDIHGNVQTATAVVTVIGQLPTSSIVSQPTSNVYTGGNANNIYLGYGAQTTVLKVNATGGSSYTYQWMGAATTLLSNTTSDMPLFTPLVAGTYTFTVLVTNNFGCTTTSKITICVRDIRVPGAKGKGKVYLCHMPPGNNQNPQTLEISVNAVASHLSGHSGDRLGSCATAACAESAPTVIGTNATRFSKAEEVVADDLKVVVMPNPTSTYFTLKLVSKSDLPVNIKVVDAAGRLVEGKAKQAANSTLQLGHNYATGSYFAEFIQGNQRKVVQLIKMK